VNEREDILRAVASKMDLTEAAWDELPRIASSKGAELFTGADLQALLYSAQLETIHTQLPDQSLRDKDPNEQVDVHDEDNSKNQVLTVPKIDVDNLQRALEQSRPSVSISERNRYNKIYKAFKGDRTADFDAVSGYADGQQRTALK